MEYKIKVSPLTPREAVADALYRAVIGLDTNDLKMFESAFTTNAIFQRDDIVMDGLESIKKDLFEPLMQMDTHHTIGNVRVDIDADGSKAKMTTYTLAQHHRKGEGMDSTKKGLLGGTTYFIDLIKDDGGGLWRMRNGY